MSNLVSIIMPVYCVENYIANSIQSVLTQSYNNFELLVIDDGSPDKSMEEVQQFEDARIKIFHKVNGGLSDARNYGLERASGEYVYFMDSDDWIEAGLLKENIEVLETENLDFLIFGYIQDDENKEGVVLKSTRVVPHNKALVKNTEQIHLDSHTLGILGYAWNKIYRKEFLNKHKLKFEKGTSLVEDILFNTEVYCNTNTLRFVDKPYYHYINRADATLMKTFHPDSFELKKRKTQQLEKFFDEWKVLNKTNMLAHSIIQGVRYCVHNLFAYENQLSFEEKVAYIKMMIKDPLTKKHINNYKTASFTDRIYKYLIITQSAFMIAAFAKITK